MIKKKILDTLKKNTVCSKFYDTPISLNNDSFKCGTYRIQKPGIYRLEENIVFNPIVNEVFLPNFKLYPRNIYFLGFFAAITIECDYVELDLNNFSIEMSPIFSLIQRFFSIIELANTPFVNNQGPTGTFDDNGILCAKYVVIKNGIIGNSSHTSIHGNNNEFILIENLKMKDFETGGIVLNNSKNIVCDDLEIGPSNNKVLMNSSFFAFVNIVRTIFTRKLNELNNNCLKTYEINLSLLVFNEIVHNFKNNKSILGSNEILNKIIKQFQNKTGIPDGSALYGLSFTPSGISINQIGCCIDTKKENELSNNLEMKNILIKDLILDTKENIAIKIDGKIIRGAFGEIISFNKDIQFLTDLQLALWEIILKYNLKKNISTTFNLKPIIFKQMKKLYDNFFYDININECINYKFVYGGDIMSHFNKGIMGIRLTAVNKVLLKNISICNFKNYSIDTLYDKCNKKHEILSHNNISMFSFRNYIGSSIFGIITFNSNAILNNYETNELLSSHGDICEVIILKE